MLEDFKVHISKEFPFLYDARFLVACSGGVDSVVLASLCHQLNLNFDLAHCNFQLRAKESDLDQELVQDLAKQMERHCFVTHFDTKHYAKNNRGSVQMAARDLRYTWFKELMQQKEYAYVLTAHHQDDALETFIINLSRGTGIDGLKGIPPKNGAVIRPLLPYAKDQILAYAAAHNIQWREDQSNTDISYLRNKIRKESSPILKEMHPSFLNNFSITQANLRETASFLEDYRNIVQVDLFQEHQEGMRISIASLLKLQPQEGYLRFLFKEFGFTEWRNIAGLLTANSGKEVHSKTHRLLKDRGFLILKEIAAKNQNEYTFDEETPEITAPLHLQISRVDSVADTQQNAIYVDKEKISFPLVIRKWREGDYFYPFGMQGRKKLSKYFKDEKMDVFSKEKQWLLCSDKKVVWVIGKRLDRRFQVTDETKEILKFRIKQ